MWKDTYLFQTSGNLLRWKEQEKDCVGGISADSVNDLYGNNLK
jgi:hypothetical protein